MNFEQFKLEDSFEEKEIEHKKSHHKVPNEMGTENNDNSNSVQMGRRRFIEKFAAGLVGAGIGVLGKQISELEEQVKIVESEVPHYVEDVQTEEIVDEVAKFRDEVAIRREDVVSEQPEVEEQEVQEIQEIQNETEQAPEEISNNRELVNYHEFKKMRPDLFYEEKYLPQIENLNMPDKAGRFGASTHEGKILRTLRYKNITDAVEERYKLPSGVLMSMIMQESTGVDLLPNAGGDGGFGLSHMQGATACEFSLKTFGGCNSMVCGPRVGVDGKHRILGCKDENNIPLNHGKGLANFMHEHKDDRQALIDADDRLHFVLNIDTVGRMLASHIGGSKMEGLSSFETAIARYSGLKNFKKDYWKNIKRNMRDLESSEMMEKVSDFFNDANPDLKINGKSTDFVGYIQSCFKVNENYDLEKYKKLQKYETKNSQEVMNNYKKLIIVK